MDMCSLLGLQHTHLQALVLLERFVRAEEAEEFLGRVIDKALCNEPHPRFRFLFEVSTRSGSVNAFSIDNT